MTVIGVKEKPKAVDMVASQGQSSFPSLCQILCSLCYSPTCCSTVQGPMQNKILSALGTVQILVGLFNIGLGPGRTSLHPGDFAHLEVAYWLGGVLVAAGVATFFADGLPSVFCVSIAALFNLIASIVTVVGIAFYAIDLRDNSINSLCSYSRSGTPVTDDNCIYVLQYFKRLLTATDITMIVLVLLQLCVSITLTVLFIKALLGRRKDSVDKVAEVYQPVMIEVHAIDPEV